MVCQIETVRAPEVHDVERDLAALRDLATATRRLERAGFEELPENEFRLQIVPAVLRLGQLTAHVLGRLLTRYERPLDEDEETAPLAESPPDEVADTLFVARLQVGQAIEDLRRLGPISEHWELVAQCNRFRGLIESIVAAVGRAVAAREGLGSDQEQEGSDLRQALLIRRIYTALHAVVYAVPDPPPDRIRERLAAIEAVMRDVLGSTLARLIRVGDRLQLRRLHEKLHLWLVSGSVASPEDGAHLWQDAGAVAEMLVQINNRQELIAHDRHQAQLMLGRLVAADVAGTDSPDLLELASALRGRDRELDASLHELEQLLHRRVIPQLRGLVHRFRLSAGSAGGR